MKNNSIIGILILGIGLWFFLLRMFELNEIKNLKLMPFTAEVVQIYNDGRTKTIEKVFLGLKNERVETVNTISIYRGDLNLMWILTTPPTPLTYVEVPLKQNHVPTDNTLRISRFPSKGYLGVKIIDGQKVYEFREPRDKCKVSTFISSKTLIPLEMDWYCGEFNKIVMKFENIKPGEPLSSVFDIPEGYKKVDAKDLLEAGKMLNPR